MAMFNIFFSPCRRIKPNIPQQTFTQVVLPADYFLLYIDRKKLNNGKADLWGDRNQTGSVILGLRYTLRTRHFQCFLISSIFSTLFYNTGDTVELYFDHIISSSKFKTKLKTKLGT